MSRRSSLASLIESAPTVFPSLLLCDFGNLQQEVLRLEAAGIHGLHLDVMDGKFVPNLTYGMPIVKAIRGLTDLLLDVHLMIAEPERYIEQFYEAGADIITIHIEAVNNPRKVLEQIRQLGVGAGIALNPETPLSQVDGCIDLCDMLLVMSVHPGFGGQTFHPQAIKKLKQARALAGSDILVEVDGGVNESTIGECGRAGAQVLVAGSAIFRHKDYGSAVDQLTKLVRDSRDEVRKN